MKAASRDCLMTATVELTEREVEMLGWLAGYGGEAIARAIAEKLTSKFRKEEWEDFWRRLRTELEFSTRRFYDTRTVFLGLHQAVAPVEKPTIEPETVNAMPEAERAS